MLNARQFTEQVQIYTSVVTEGDRGNITTYTDAGFFPANVDAATGSKALYYQEKGFGHQITVKIRYYSGVIGKIIWDGKTIYPRSILRVNNEGKSDTRGNYLVIEGGYKDDKG